MSRQAERFHPNLNQSIRAHSQKPAFGSWFATTHAILQHPDESVEDLKWSSRAHRKRRYRSLDEKGRSTSEEEEIIWTKVKRMGKIEWKELSWWIAVVRMTVCHLRVFLDLNMAYSYSLSEVSFGSSMASSSFFLKSTQKSITKMSLEGGGQHGSAQPSSSLAQL
jgi:hypothetical protein